MNQLCQSVQCSMDKELQVADEGTANDVSSTQDVDSGEQSSSTKSSADENLIANQNSDEPEQKSIDSLTNIEEAWLDQLADLFVKMNTNLSQTCKAADDLRDSLVQSAQSFQCISSALIGLKRTIEKKQAGEQETEHSDENME